LTPNPIYLSASSTPPSDGQVPPHFSGATACMHDLALQLKPVTLLGQPGAATHPKPLTSDSCNKPAT